MKYLLVKFFIFLIATFVLLFVYFTVCDINPYTAFLKKAKVNNFDADNAEVRKSYDLREENGTIAKENNNTNMKYILQWTPRSNSPFVYMGKGQEVLIKNKCKYTNCYVTSNVNRLGDITKFDVVAFNGPDVRQMKQSQLPQKRSPHQKYVFASIESSHYYPVCNSIFDGYFNWTWTFRLDSDSKWGYLVVRDENNNIIGPKKDMHWMKTEDMKPVPSELLSKFKQKSKAAAWFVSNCNSRSKREVFVNLLEIELNKYGLKIDVYGNCGRLRCERRDEKLCEGIIEKDYFFYLAFENSFAEDYVTEKILHGLQNSAIPIVYGGANYSRFVPEGSYINARELGAKELAAKINNLIHNIEEYSSYFKWRSHYSFHRRVTTPETDDYCGYCALLNDEKKMKETTVYQNLRDWWNPANFRCPGSTK